MSGKYISTSAIGDLLGYTNPASTRKWILRYELQAKERDVESGEKLYLRSEVEAALNRRPGQGARTDLAPTEGPTDDGPALPGTD